MEFQLPSLILVLLTFFLVLLFTVIVKHTKTYKSNSSASRLPPGPWKLPLIGNIHQLAVSPLVHHTLRDLANKYGPLMHLQLGEISTVVVSSPEMATEVLKTHDTIFASRPNLLAAEILFYKCTDIAFSYGDYWRQVRKICVLEVLSPQRVHTFQVIREEEVLKLIDSVSSDARARTPINLSRRMLSLTNGITARAAFGQKSKHQEKFISILQDVSTLVAGFSIVDVYPSLKFLEVFTGTRRKMEAVHKTVDEVLQVVLDEHKEKEGTRPENQEAKSEDLVDVLLRVQKAGNLEFELTDDNIKAVIFDIFSAGGETSSTTVEWALSELMINPDVMERAQAEVREVFGEKGNVDESGLHVLKYLKLVIKETLRLHPPFALLLPRECREDCEINGYLIPATTRVIVNSWAISRDPKHWTEPEKFYPDRFLNSGIDFRGSNFKYIPFGAGRRICPAISFASANIELLLAQLLYHFDWEFPGTLRREEFDMTEAFGIETKRKIDLCLIPIPCHSSNTKKVFHN